MNKKISIITPAYNAEKYIENNMLAIIKSNYDLKNVEHIIIDDGSTDNTKAICNTYAAKYSHIKFYSKENGNWGSVINYVKHNSLASGDYIVICDADDRIAPNAFNLINLKNNDADIVVGDFWLFNGKRKTLRCPTYWYIFKTNFIKKHPKDYMNSTLLPCSTYFKKEVFYKTNDLISGLIYQDCVFYAELQLFAKKIKHIKRAISLYWNVRDGNTQSQKISKKAIDSQLSNLMYCQKNKLFDLFVLLSIYHTANVLKYSKIKFDFSDCKLKLNAYPLYFRIYTKILFHFKCKKYLKK